MNVLYHKLMTYGSVFEFARIDLQMDAMATSHYARTDVGDNIDRFTEMRGTFIQVFQFICIDFSEWYVCGKNRLKTKS